MELKHYFSERCRSSDPVHAAVCIFMNNVLHVASSRLRPLQLLLHRPPYHKHDRREHIVWKVKQLPIKFALLLVD